MGAAQDWVAQDTIPAPILQREEWGPREEGFWLECSGEQAGSAG